MGDRARNHGLQPRLSEERLSLGGFGEPRGQPVELGREQLAFELPGRCLPIPTLMGRALLVGAYEESAALLSEVTAARGIAHDWKLGMPVHELAHRLGDHVMMQE